jgi:hypothetical protein
MSHIFYYKQEIAPRFVSFYESILLSSRAAGSDDRKESIGRNNRERIYNVTNSLRWTLSHVNKKKNNNLNSVHFIRAVKGNVCIYCVIAQCIHNLNFRDLKFTSINQRILELVSEARESLLIAFYYPINFNIYCQLTDHATL